MFTCKLIKTLFLINKKKKLFEGVALQKHKKWDVAIRKRLKATDLTYPASELGRQTAHV